MEANAAAEPRTYGNWRAPGGGGLFGLGKVATYAGLGWGAFSMALMIPFGPLVGFGMLIVGLAGIALGSVPLLGTGRTTLGHVAPRAAHAWARLTGQARHRSGLLSRQPNGAVRLPGLAASTMLLPAVDAQGRPFAVVHAPGKRHFTVVLTADPDGATLVDDHEVDLWLDQWAAWLGALGDEPGLTAVSVTVETAPDTGERLRREINGSMSPDAHAVPAAMLREIADTYPAGSATVRAYVAVTFTGARTETPEDTVRDIAGRVAHLAAGLHGTGAGVARPMTRQELCEAIRTAYDPDAQAIFDDARSMGGVAVLDWRDVGPVAADASYSTYRHDSGASCTWMMTSAPRGSVTAGVLGRLLRPHPDIARKRVTLVYRPLSSANAARLVERDHRDAEATVRNAKRPTARMLNEQKSAERMAADEARGAGLLSFGLLITATVTDPDRLPAARRVVEQLAPTARIRIRPVHGGQEAAFAACLPLGIVLPAHKRSTRIKEGL